MPSVQPRTNVRLAGISQHLLLQVQLRVSLTLRHVNSHGGNVDMNVLMTLRHSEPSDLFMSNHNINARWPRPRFDSSNLLRNCNDLAGVEQQLRNARGPR